MKKFLIVVCGLIGVTTPIQSSILSHSLPSNTKQSCFKLPFLKDTSRFSFTSIQTYKPIPLGRWILDHPKICLSAVGLTSAAIIGLKYYFWYKKTTEQKSLQQVIQTRYQNLFGNNTLSIDTDTIESYSQLWNNSCDFFSWLCNTRKNLEDQAFCSVLEQNLSPSDSLPKQRPWTSRPYGNTIIFESKTHPLSLQERILYSIGLKTPLFIGPNSENVSDQRAHKNLFETLKTLFDQWQSTALEDQNPIKAISIQTDFDPIIQKQQLYTLSHHTVDTAKDTTFTTLKTKEEAKDYNLTIIPPVCIYGPQAPLFGNKNTNIELSDVKKIEGNGHTLLGALTVGYSIDFAIWLIHSLLTTEKKPTKTDKKA